METEKRGLNMMNYTGCENTFKKNHSEKINVERVISIQRILQLPQRNFKLLKFIIAILIAFNASMITFAQLPNLGTAKNFAVFTTIGALGNTGTSNITGNIGTNDGATSGFGAPTVVDGNIESANGVTAQCAIDVQAAYNELFAVVPTVVDHPPAFGSGEILPPGVYNIGAAGSIAGNLTLDAEGDTHAIFIFQFGGAFTTGASSNVSLINGASACNVFWIAEGAMSMPALTNMKGTLISNNGAISLGAGGTLDGRMLSTAGEASVYDAVISLPNCVNLPISLLSFTVACSNQLIILEWETATETNNDFFTIERSQGTENWNVVGTVPGAGNSTSLLKYTLRDTTDNEGITYYRLKQTDYNGNFKYGAIVGINKCEDNIPDRFTIYPNPSKGEFKLLFDGHTSEINSIHILNSQGQSIYSSIDFQSMFDLSNNIPGFYFMRIQHNLEITNLKFVISN